MCMLSRLQLVTLVLSFLIGPGASFAIQSERDSQQDTQSDSDKPFDVTDTQPGGGTFEVYMSRDGKQSLRFVSDFFTFNMKLSELRLISFPSVQEDLELSSTQLKRLKEIREKIFAFDMVWKWEQTSICKPVRDSARQNIADLREQVNAGEELHEILLPHQLERLYQIQRRYLLFTLADARRNRMTAFAHDFIQKRWQLDSQAVSQLTRIVSDEMESIKKDNHKWDTDVALKKIESFYEDADLKLLQQLVKDRAIFSSIPLQRSAQMGSFFHFSEIEEGLKKPDELPATKINDHLDFSFEVINPLILPNGRFTSSSAIIDRSELSFPDSKWQRVAQLVNFGESEWFTLAEFQKQELESLVQMKEFDDASGSGMRYVYLDDDQWQTRFQQIRENQPIQTEEAAYRKYIDEMISFRRSRDSKMETAIRKALLPHQLDSLQFSVGAPQMGKLGLYQLLMNNMLGKRFALTNSQKKELTELVEERRKEEIETLKKLETKAIAALSIEQRKQFKQLFGDPLESLPTFITAFDSSNAPEVKQSAGR